MSRGDKDTQSEHADLLAEYDQLCQYHRHGDTLRWTVIAATVGGAVLVIGFSLQSYGILTMRSVVMTISAALLVTVGTAIYAQSLRFDHIRFIRAREIERLLGFNSHEAIHALRGKPAGEDKWVCSKLAPKLVGAGIWLPPIAVALHASAALLIPQLEVSTRMAEQLRSALLVAITTASLCFLWRVKRWWRL